MMQQTKLVLWSVLGGFILVAISSAVAYLMTRTGADSRIIIPVEIIQSTTTTKTTPALSAINTNVQTADSINEGESASTSTVVPKPPISEPEFSPGTMPELRSHTTHNSPREVISKSTIGEVSFPKGNTDSILLKAGGSASSTWVTLSNESDEVFDTIELTYQFTSHAEGLLSVFIDDQVVFKADERDVDFLSSIQPLNMARTVSSGRITAAKILPGQHSLSFRLDRFSKTESSVFIYDIKTSSTSIVQVRNKLPVAVIASMHVVKLGDLITLNGGGSYDPDKKPLPLTYNWAQTDGPKVLLYGPTWLTPTFTPIIKGTYKFSLRVNDGQSYSNTATVTVLAE